MAGLITPYCSIWVGCTHTCQHTLSFSTFYLAIEANWICSNCLVYCNRSMVGWYNFRLAWRAWLDQITWLIALIRSALLYRSIFTLRISSVATLRSPYGKLLLMACTAEEEAMELVSLTLPNKLPSTSIFTWIRSLAASITLTDSTRHAVANGSNHSLLYGYRERSANYKHYSGVHTSKSMALSGMLPDMALVVIVVVVVVVVMVLTVFALASHYRVGLIGVDLLNMPSW